MLGRCGRHCAVGKRESGDALTWAMEKSERAKQMLPAGLTTSATQIMRCDVKTGVGEDESQDWISNQK